MEIITLSGLDGSGKTTQLELLQKELEANKKSVYTLHIISFSLANKLFATNTKRKRKSNNKKKEAKAVTKAGFLAIFLRKLALLIDSFRFNQLVLALKMNGLYDYVLVDRYFYDQIANIHYLENNFSPKHSPWWQKLAEKIMFKPNCSIFIKVDSKIAISRDREIEQGEQFLKDKQKIFDKFTSRWNIRIIDGNNSVKKVSTDIKKTIKL